MAIIMSLIAVMMEATVVKIPACRIPALQYAESMDMIVWYVVCIIIQNLHSIFIEQMFFS